MAINKLNQINVVQAETLAKMQLRDALIYLLGNGYLDHIIGGREIRNEIVPALYGKDGNRESKRIYFYKRLREVTKRVQKA